MTEQEPPTQSTGSASAAAGLKEQAVERPSTHQHHARRRLLAVGRRIRRAADRAHQAFLDDLTATRRAELVAYSTFAVTVAATRGVTRLIRAGRGPFGYTHVGPLHIHHYIHGIALLTVAGYVGMRGSPLPSVHCLNGAAFGAGTALVADELPMLVELRDVYWTPEGAWRVRLTVTITALWGATSTGKPLWHAAVSGYRQGK